MGSTQITKRRSTRTSSRQPRGRVSPCRETAARERKRSQKRTLAQGSANKNPGEARECSSLRRVLALQLQVDGVFETPEPAKTLNLSFMVNFLVRNCIFLVVQGIIGLAFICLFTETSLAVMRAVVLARCPPNLWVRADRWLSRRAGSK